MVLIRQSHSYFCSLPLKEVGKLPQKVNCHQCGYVLYQGEELRSPEEILQVHEGKCPKCGTKLSLSPMNVDVGASSKNKFSIKIPR